MPAFSIPAFLLACSFVCLSACCLPACSPACVPSCVPKCVGLLRACVPLHRHPKDNNVLRFFSGNAFLISQCVKYKLGKLPASGLKWQELDNERDFEKDSEGAIKTCEDGSKLFKAGM